MYCLRRVCPSPHAIGSLTVCWGLLQCVRYVHMCTFISFSPKNYTLILPILKALLKSISCAGWMEKDKGGLDSSCCPMVEDRVYCWGEGEHSQRQRRLGEFLGVNMTLSWALWGERGRRRESQETKRPRFQKGKRTSVAKMTGLYREKQLGEGRGYLLEFRVRGGLCEPWGPYNR